MSNPISTSDLVFNSLNAGVTADAELANLASVASGLTFAGAVDTSLATSSMAAASAFTAKVEVNLTSSDRIRQASKQLQQACHFAALDSGWWHDPKTGAPITDNPMCFSNKLCLIHSEISEAMEGDRKGLMDDKLSHREMREVELADAIIRIFDLAGGFNLDLAGAIAEKMAYNAHRPDHKIENRTAEGGKTY